MKKYSGMAWQVLDWNEPQLIFIKNMLYILMAAVTAACRQKPSF
jgi:hypothetical protein